MLTDTFAVHYLLHSAALVEDALRDRLALIGLRPRQARILDALSWMGPASQADLARAFDVTPASMSTMAARLTDSGHVTRIVDPDSSHSNKLELSVKGTALLADIHTAWRDVDALIATKLGPEAAASLSDLTQKLRNALGGHPPGHEPLP